jgi:hypothetical protein
MKKFFQRRGQGIVILSIGLVLGYSIVTFSGIVTKPNTFTGQTSPQLPWLDSDFDTLYSEFNGNIDDANIKNNAGIQESKISNLVSDLAARLLLAGGQLTGDLSLKKTTPAVRLIGTEGSAKDWQMVESAGSILLQENTGTEGTPTWVTRVTLPAGTAGFHPYLGRAIDNLVVVRTDANTSTVTADNLVLLDTSGGQFIAHTVNVAPSLAAAGANGLDTGSEASSTWYYLYVIYNGTTVAGLYSLSATAPTMPSGYTYKALVSAVRNDGSSNTLPFKQVGGNYLYDDPVKVGDNVGSQTTASLSLATAVPPSRVKSVWGKVLNNTGADRTFFWDAITFANSLVNDNSDAAFQLIITASSSASWSLPVLREAQTMYIQNSGAQTMDVWLSSFSFDWS